MVLNDKNTETSTNASEGNAKLQMLIQKKGKRNISGFKKSFGEYPDFPSIVQIRKIAWK